MLLSAGGHRPHGNTLLTFILKYQAGGGYRIEKSKTLEFWVVRAICAAAAEGRC